jgi:hypothetical protein
MENGEWRMETISLPFSFQEKGPRDEVILARSLPVGRGPRDEVILAGSLPAG